MRTLTYISDNNQMVSFVDKPPYMLGKVLSGLDASAQTEKSPGRDGAYTYGTQLNQKSIRFTGQLVAEGNYRLGVESILDEHKNNLDSCFNPKVFGTLIYNDNKGGQIIRARPLTTPTYGEHINKQSCSIQIELVSDSPYWESFNLHTEKIGAIINMWKFPFTLPLTFGEYISRVTIKNPTKIEIEPYFEVYSNAQDVTMVNETTGAHITVNHAIRERETMVIDTKTATVRLYDNGELVKDVSNWITSDSDFITLAPGKNVISISNETQDDIASAAIFYRLSVLGV